MGLLKVLMSVCSSHTPIILTLIFGWRLDINVLQSFPGVYKVHLCVQTSRLIGQDAINSLAPKIQCLVNSKMKTKGNKD